MKDASNRTPAFLPLIAVTLLGITGCETASPPPMQVAHPRVLTLLETNCVHCHGQQRLQSMPSFADTKSLAALIGPGKWIVPGHPENSRFFQVVALADNQPTAMPPTGHAISKSDLETLRRWIKEGAKLPAKNIALQPRGTAPRSL